MGNSHEQQLALIFIGGEYPSRERLEPLLCAEPYIIAADSGLHAVHALGLEPNLLVGDMDSVRDDILSLYNELEICRFPADKDYTDTELGLEEALRRGYAQRILVGGGGGRLDHVFAIRDLFERKTCPQRWYTAQEEIICLEGTIEVDFPIGLQLSFFPLVLPLVLHSKGLYWKLDGIQWVRGQFGVSNRVSGSMQVAVSEGRVLLIRQFTDACNQAISLSALI